MTNELRLYSTTTAEKAQIVYSKIGIYGLIASHALTNTQENGKDATNRNERKSRTFFWIHFKRAAPPGKAVAKFGYLP